MDASSLEAVHFGEENLESSRKTSLRKYILLKQMYSRIDSRQFRSFSFPVGIRQNRSFVSLFNLELWFAFDKNESSKNRQLIV